MGNMTSKRARTEALDDIISTLNNLFTLTLKIKDYEEYLKLCEPVFLSLKDKLNRLNIFPAPFILLKFFYDGLNHVRERDDDYLPFDPSRLRYGFYNYYVQLLRALSKAFEDLDVATPNSKMNPKLYGTYVNSPRVAAEKTIAEKIKMLIDMNFNLIRNATYCDDFAESFQYQNELQLLLNDAYNKEIPPALKNFATLAYGIQLKDNHFYPEDKKKLLKSLTKVSLEFEAFNTKNIYQYNMEYHLSLANHNETADFAPSMRNN